MQYKYKIKDWNGKVHRMTATELRDRVLADSKNSNFNWITSATELVRVCSNPNFPEKYAIDIKIAILNCFADVEKLGRWRCFREPTDSAAVYFCFNSLLGNEEEVIKAKHKYLAEFIRSASCVPRYNFSFHLDGETYLKFCEEWRKKKLEENASKTDIDFEQLFEKLEDDFSQTVKFEEERGSFQEDDEKWRQKIRTYIDAALKFGKEGTTYENGGEVSGDSDDSEIMNLKDDIKRTKDELEEMRKKVRELEEVVFGDEDRINDGEEPEDE